MKQDAEAHADEDAKAKENIETRNRADQMYYATEKSLKEHADAVDDETKAGIEAAMAELKTALEGSDIEAIKKAEENLGEKSQKLGEIVYQKMQAEQAASGVGSAPGGASEAGADAASKPKDADIVDAEVVDDKK